MGTLPPEKLLQQWTLKNMTVEMAAGHTLQNLVKLQQAIDAIQISLRKLRTDVDSLIVHTAMKSNPKDRKKPLRKN